MRVYVSGICVGVQIFHVNTKHGLLGGAEQELRYDLNSESACGDTRCPQGGASGTLTSLPAGLKRRLLNGRVLIGDSDVDLMWARCAP